MMRRRFMNSSNSVPLSFEALEDGLSISFSNEILYRINGGAWETLLARENTEEVSKGSVISFQHAKSIRGDGSIGEFSINKKCNVSGLCSSIIPKVLGEKHMSPMLFSALFNDCDTIVDASKLELPAKTLASNCYQFMFSGCSSLVNAPELPATTLAIDCYHFMFKDCSILVNAPELPATTLANYCYYGMFEGCTKLNYIKMLATDISARNCLYYWVSGVSSTGTFVKNPAMTSLPAGNSGIPSGWTVVNDGEESGGGKIVNHGFLTIKQSSKQYEATVVFDFPCASTISIRVTSSVGTSVEGISEGNISRTFTGMGKFQSFTYSPTEDDTYIYEVTIE